MNHNIEYLCELFTASTNLPLSYFSGSGKIIRTFYNIDQKIELIVFNQMIDSFRNIKKNPSELITDSDGFYGIIHIESSDEFVILGPIFSIPVTNNQLQEFMRENAIPYQFKEQTYLYLKSIPNLYYHQFLVNLQLLHYIFNGKKIDITTHFYLSAPTFEESVAARHTLQSYESKEHTDFHNTYQFEQQLFDYIKNGETEKIKELTSSNQITAHLKEGIVGDSPLRQAKNIFIGLIAIIGKKAAIPGGLDIEETYQLIDIYSQSCEKLRSINEVINLQYAMIFDFSERVKRRRMPIGSSREIFECIDYINKHTNEKLSITDVANHVGKSVSSISHKFKDELGFSIGEFMIRSKLEEAKSLLTYSDKSIVDISNYLCFSSQSYFQNVFKKKFGLTPNQYRKKK